MTKKMAYECLVCGTTLGGPLGLLFHLFGVRRSMHNPNVCNRCGAHMQEGRVIELSVIFADLADFTEMTNRLGPERSYEVVNAFFKMASDALIKNDAFIDKYIGDAVMAIFNAPIPNAKHARGATTAALDIQEGLKSVSHALGLDLQARVGIATGYARVGRLGSTDRKDYTAIGDVVNLASRLETFAKPGEVIVDGKAFSQVAEDYPDLIPEELNVRGFAEPVEIYRIGKSDRENAAISVQQPDPLATRQKVGLGTVLFTIFGAPCAVAITLSPLAIALGLGSVMGALSPAFNTLDAAQIRIPLQVFAVLAAIINLYVIRRGNLQRQQFDTSALTAHEKYKVNFVIGLSVFSLLAVAYETYIHIFVLGMSYFSPTL
ncbi:MAG: adenylate/guanylate cyclase domain-containing protein [Nitrosomonadales bacterium]|nr:adenylate/guanylate cyclase domain-containing protein [Nitrosomonadales bacterium]